MADINSDMTCAKDSVALTASATAFEPTRAIFVEVAGSATLQFLGGTTTAFTALPVGLLPWCVKKFTAGTATIHAQY